MSSNAVDQLLHVCVCITELREEEGTSLHFHSVRMKAYWPVWFCFFFFDSIQLIVFKITCSFQTVVRRDSCTQMK